MDLNQLAPEQRKVYDEIVAGPRGRVVGPLLVWLPSPGNWFAPPGSNRSGGGGNKAVGAFDVKGRLATRRAGRP